MHLGNAEAANTVTNFMGTSFMLCLFGGFVSDTFLGRYLTIAIFAAVQALISYVHRHALPTPALKPLPALELRSGSQLGVLYFALYLTALGTGGLKSSVSGFGSDQFDEKDQAEKVQMMWFFNWFFFFISLGSLLAVTVLVYIQDNFGRKWGYGLCAGAICFGLIVFLSGTKRYRFKKLVGSPLAQIAAVVVAAWRKRKVELPADPALLYNGDGDEQKVEGEEDGSMRSKLEQKLPHTKQFRGSGNRHLGHSFKIPAGSLTVFFVSSILLTVPIYDQIVVPVSRHFTGNPHGLTPLQRIGVGLVMSILAMVVAALAEIKRLKVARSNPAYLQKGAIVPISVFWLVPQFFFVGSGQAFTYIGQLDFFLRECPKGMKTMSTGLFLSTLSLGFFVSSILVAIVHKITGQTGHKAWLADNLNRGKLYNFYWLLAAMCLVNFFLYLVAARWYVYKESRTPEDESMADVELVEAEASFAKLA
ncbi:protein NRT1/ PTR FAMILY 6.3-like isoform X2 [Carex littledalei]|uniref:Protein NRT1/ PTR FAMILY 6.3-like isoform X2 n=1 Tax=Carex littledalei TaxID=544730 RepID=A0A833QF73_9POAL|nr:protein NRT1/ PTR FAMILY 6.3-like isoform X2 [Carex littledalei]